MPNARLVAVQGQVLMMELVRYAVRCTIWQYDLFAS